MPGATLIIMAAGMGARFGGLKQITPIGKGGETVAEFSAYDAVRAGFSRVVFVIKPGMEEEFSLRVTSRMKGRVRCDLVAQRPDDLPGGTPPLPAQRVKPLGTAHALWCCRDAVNEPFAVINADDFYGASAFREIFGFLRSHPDAGAPHPYCMAAYRLSDTVSEHGSVSRGICEVDDGGRLVSVTERTRIERCGDSFTAREDGAEVPLSGEEPVSLNAWGFHPSVFAEMEASLRAFLELPADTLKSAEWYLPAAVADLLRDGRADVFALPARDKWIGVTYPEDFGPAQETIRRMTEDGLYPASLWAGETTS